MPTRFSISATCAFSCANWALRCVYCLLRLIADAEVEVDVEDRWELAEGVVVGLVEEARLEEGAVDIFERVVRSLGFRSRNVVGKRGECQFARNGRIEDGSKHAK